MIYRKSLTATNILIKVQKNTENGFLIEIIVFFLSFFFSKGIGNTQCFLPFHMQYRYVFRGRCIIRGVLLFDYPSLDNRLYLPRESEDARIMLRAIKWLSINVTCATRRSASSETASSEASALVPGYYRCPYL